MFQRFTDLLTTSIGKKALMSATGLLLVGFLVLHLAGNLTLFADDTGAAFNRYAQALASNRALMYAAEALLALLFLAHIALGLRVSMENRSARPRGYALSRDRGSRTFSSNTMLITGVVVLGFLVIHITDFRLRERSPDGLAAMVFRRLSEPAGALIYLVGVIALGIHLSHAFRSALQTLGVNHPRYNRAIHGAGRLIAIGLAIGFAAFPVLLLGDDRSEGRVARSQDSKIAPAEGPSMADVVTPEDSSR